MGTDLFSGITFKLNKGDRIGLIGKNGAGKSTLLKVLSKDIESSAGTMAFDKDIQIGFLRQDIDFVEGRTILEEAYQAFEEKIAKSFGKKYNPKVFDPNTPMKCLVLRDYGPESPSRIIGGASRIIWAQAWLDLATLAKTFPQHIQPSHLSLLINAYEPAKACVADYKCVPKGL